MFNWFKNNHKVLVPNDFSDGLLTSLFAKVKVGSKLVVPENSICFVSFHDKDYATLTSGSYEFTRSNFASLFEKQTNKKTELKELNVDLFFLNLTSFSRTYSFKEKYKINNQTCKLTFSLDLDLKISNEEKFKSLILGEVAFASAKITDEILNEYFYIFLKNFFLRKKFSYLSLEAEEKEEFNKKLIIYASKIGLEISNINLQITSNTPVKEKPISIFNKKQKSDEPQSIFSNSQETTKNNETLSVEKEENAKKDISEIKENQTETIDEEVAKEYNKIDVCPNCKRKIIKGSIFCHICGYNLI
ncbi:MAG: hypothetical protein E7374_00275 [Clostridiales bacterium]|nr:hypothetical protein [Clostridiales bacterium]